MASGSSRAEGKLRSRGCTSFQLGHLAWDLRSGDKEEIQRKQTNQLASGWGQWEEENKDLKAMVTPKHFPREQPSLKVQFGKWVERNRKLPLSKANVEVNREIIISPLGIEASLVLHYLDSPTKLEGCFLGFTSRREKPQDSSVLACRAQVPRGSALARAAPPRYQPASSLLSTGTAGSQDGLSWGLGGAGTCPSSSKAGNFPTALSLASRKPR